MMSSSEYLLLESECSFTKLTLIFRLFRGYLSLEHKYKDRSKLGNFALALLPTHPPLHSRVTHTLYRVPSTHISPLQDPQTKMFTPWPRNCQMILNKLDFSTITPCRRSKFKVLQTTLNTWICLYFCINKDNLDVYGLFPFHWIFYELDIYALKWLNKYKCMRKRSLRAMTPPPPPNSNPVWASSPPQHSQKLASMHLEMKGHGSRVSLWEALHKIYTWPVSFDFPM